MTKKQKALAAIEALKKEYPDAECALIHSNPLQLLIATRLSAQCTDARVNMVTPALFERFPTIDDFINSSEEEIAEYIRTCGLFKTKARDIFAMCKKLKEEFPNAEIFAGISCVSYFCAKIGMAYDDMNIVSMHGRNCNIVSEVRENEKTFVLLGENPCDKLCRYGFENAEVYIGENLSYENEKILHGKAKDFRDTKLASLSVAVIINNEYDKCTKIGINDSEFVTGNAPMTKSEVRAVSISKLEIKYDDICYDIGAGTGSVSIEMALLCGKGKVYAIEKKAEAAELIKQNALKFHADNIEIICADAPNGMDGLPKADKVFIGGSSGNLYEIIEKCDCKKVVVNAITLETLSLAQESFEKLGYEYSVTQICASRGRKVGGYNMMTAQNPVFIICGEKL